MSDLTQANSAYKGSPQSRRFGALIVGIVAYSDMSAIKTWLLLEGEPRIMTHVGGEVIPTCCTCPVAMKPGEYEVVA